MAKLLQLERGCNLRHQKTKEASKANQFLSEPPFAQPDCALLEFQVDTIISLKNSNHVHEQMKSNV